MLGGPGPGIVKTVLLDTSPTFPKDFFSLDALRARFASVIVSDLAGQPPLRGPEPNASQKRVAGRVLAGETRRPIANALVRVAVPAINLRQIRTRWRHPGRDEGTKPEIYETRTDPNGWFEVLVPTGEGKDTLALDAVAPGYGSGAANADFNPTARGVLDPSYGYHPGMDTSNLTILLPRGIYIAGIVKDAQGTPAAGVQIEGSLRSSDTTYIIIHAETNAQGRFEIFDVPVRESPRDGRDLTLSFDPPNGAPVTMGGLYELSDQQRASLEVTLSPGLKITGVLLDTDGRPAVGVNVNAKVTGGMGAIVDGRSLLADEAELPRFEKCVRTDSNGRFELGGLGSDWFHSGGASLIVMLWAGSPNIDQKVGRIITLRDPDEDVTLRMERIDFEDSSTPIVLFGMRLVDTPWEFKSLGLDSDFRGEGVLVLDPGVQHQRLGLGKLKKGCRFLTIGPTTIGSVHEFVAALLKEATPPWVDREDETAQARGFIHDECLTQAGGMVVQSLALTHHDVEELRRLAEKLGVPVPNASR